MLWPGKPPSDGANNLYRAIHDLRSVIGEESVTLRQSPYDGSNIKEGAMKQGAAAFLTAVLLVTATVRAAEAEKKSLYNRLGGAYAIATVVDAFIEKLLVNDTLNANPAIREARARVPKAGLKFHVTPK